MFTGIPAMVNWLMVLKLPVVCGYVALSFHSE